MGVYVVDIVRRQAGIGYCLIHGPLSAFAVDARRDHVVRVGGGAVAGELGQDVGAAALRVLLRFEDEEGGALGADETVTARIERPGRLQRLVLAGR